MSCDLREDGGRWTVPMSSSVISGGVAIRNACAVRCATASPSRLLPGALVCGLVGMHANREELQGDFLPAHIGSEGQTMAVPDSTNICEWMSVRGRENDTQIQFTCRE